MDVCERCHISWRKGTAKTTGPHLICPLCGCILHFAPTPDEIERDCLKFQANWSEREKKKRAGKPVHEDIRTYVLTGSRRQHLIH